MKAIPQVQLSDAAVEGAGECESGRKGGGKHEVEVKSTSKEVSGS